MKDIIQKKVIIYGCGTMGKRVFTPLCDNYNMKIIAYTDSRRMGGEIYGVPIIQPEKIIEEKYDYVIIAVYDFKSIRDIERKLMKIGVPKERIKALTLELDFVDVFMDQRMFWIKDFANYCYEKNIIGNTAECGVFRGDSAKFINRFFYDRKLYLFDTFDGFEESDIEYEKSFENQAYNNGSFTDKELFADTDINLLMRKMKYPDNIRIYKGYFPETTVGITDTFCFVNLDMDLYLPMYNALRFFGDKMVNGGIILLHDYFHPELPGVKKAVQDYETERRVEMNKVTVGDGCSLALLF